MKTGLDLVWDERMRQISEEDWTASHDDSHRGGELAEFACYYAYPAEGIITSPFRFEWNKRGKDTIRNLVKAGALICAEIDRLQREQALQGKEE